MLNTENKHSISTYIPTLGTENFIVVGGQYNTIRINFYGRGGTEI
jgi:hypothetical protein